MYFTEGRTDLFQEGVVRIVKKKISTCEFPRGLDPVPSGSAHGVCGSSGNCWGDL